MGEMADPFRSSRTLGVHSGDYKPALDVNAMAEGESDEVTPEDIAQMREEEALMSFLASTAALQHGTGAGSDGGSADGIPAALLPIYASFPATVAVLMPARLLSRALQCVLTAFVSARWSFPCGLRVGRQLLGDYAELKVTWCEKFVTEKRREWIREETALAARGVDVSDRVMPDFKQLINRKASKTIVKLEKSCTVSLQHISRCLAALELVSQQCKDSTAKVTTADSGTVSALLSDGHYSPSVGATKLLDSVSSVFIGIEAIQTICT